MYIRFVYSEAHKTRNTRQWTFIAPLVSGMSNFAGFLMTKTSANKRLFIYMSANDCIATVCRSGIYIARRSLTTQDVSNRKSTTNVWIVQVIMNIYYPIRQREVFYAADAAYSGACYAQSGALRHYKPKRMAKDVLPTAYLPCIYRSW